MFDDRYVRLSWLGCLFLLAACPGGGGKDAAGADADADLDVDAGEYLPGDAGDEPSAAAADSGTSSNAGSSADRPTPGSGKPVPTAGTGGSMPSKSGAAAGSGTSKPDAAAGSGTMEPAAGAGQRVWLPTPEPENTTVPRLELDRKGGLHAAYPAYAGGNAYYSYCPNNCVDPKAMKVVTLPTDGTAYTAMLALTPDGRPRVLLPTFLRIYYAECDTQCTDAANWTVSVIVEHQGDQDATGDALALDSQGRPRFLLHTYLAYLGIGQKTPQTSYAHCDSNCTNAASWTIDPIGDGIWQNSTLKLDAQDHPHVGTVVVDLEANTKQLAYLNCKSDCSTMASWNGIGLGAAFEEQTSEIKPSISLALTAAGGARVIGLSKLETGERSLVYYECDSQCEEDHWRSALMSKLPQLGSGVDIAVDAKNHTRFVFTLDDNIGLYSCDAPDCTTDGADWTLTKVEFAADLPPDGISLWPNCSVDAWILHDPTLALALDGAVRVGYEATDLSGGVATIDPTKPACIAGKDMTLSRLAMLPAVH
jgi:hypothetical protein